MAADADDDEKDLRHSDYSWDVDDPELDVAEDQDGAEAAAEQYDAEVDMELTNRVLEPAGNK